MAPLPRAYQWADGSAYVNHVELVRQRARRHDAARILDRSVDVPGRIGQLCSALHDDVVVADEAWGIDFEAEVAVVTGDVPMGVAAGETAARGIFACSCSSTTSACAI